MGLPKKMSTFFLLQSFTNTINGIGLRETKLAQAVVVPVGRRSGG